ncbi:MAG: DUF1570 domain-containing protein [Terriglobales bacterium]
MRRLATGLTIWLALLTAAAAAKPRPWRLVRSRHFAVYTDGSASEARHVAGQMERLRQVFHEAFPSLRLAGAQPLEIIAVRNWSEFRAVEPARFAQSSEKIAGVFERGQFRDFILLRLDAMDGPESLAPIYHEYTHYVFDRFRFPLPVWLNEGLAEFFQTTQIYNSSAAVGRVDPNHLQLLRHERLIPLTQLFAVGFDSPDYHDQDQASIFYAESWALVHQLMLRDYTQHTHLLRGYLQRLSQGGDADTIAAASFGNLDHLQKALQTYVRQLNYRYVQLQLRVKISQQRFTLSPVAPLEALALQAEVMARGQRFAGAQALARQVLLKDARNLQAEETLGFIAFSQHAYLRARTWLARAVCDGAGGAQAPVLLAAASLRLTSGRLAPAPAAQLAKNLHRALQRRPDYAPGFDILAQVEASQPETLPAAVQAEERAVALQPSEWVYRWNAAGMALQGRHLHHALHLFEQALSRADTAERIERCRAELGLVQNAINIRAAQQQQHRVRQAGGAP